MAHLNDNFTLRAPVPVDDRKGWWDDSTGEWKPFNDVQHALDTVVHYRYRTLTLPVVEGGDVVEYWFKNGVDDSDFVLKTSQADLSDYYTKLELQTSGQASVNWGNITDAPAFITGVDWDQIGGVQSSVEVGGFSNSIGYITASDIPAQVQSDWNATSGLAEILNKPNLAAVATTGDYDDLINKPAIPDLTGYATEQWVMDQGYLDSVSWSFDVNTGDLTIDGDTNNLDGRWLERSTTITSGYGIIASGDFMTPVNIEVDTDDLDGRYLRKDISDSNASNTLTLGSLVATTGTINSTLTLGSLATGLITDQMLVRDASTGEVKYIGMPSFGGSFNVANGSGTNQFTVDSGEQLQFVGTGDASVAFSTVSSGVYRITINSTGGSTGGGVDSWNARTGHVVPETGDYNTSQVTESGNLYFTESRVRGSLLTGFSATNSAIVATDNILQAFNKTQGQINSRVPTSRTLTVNGTSGNITVSGGTLDLSANRAWTVNLATVGTAGTYTKVTTDAYGRVVSGTTLSAGDMPSGVFQTLSVSSVTAGLTGISGGNTVTLTSTGRTLVSTNIITGWPSTVNVGLWPFSNSTGSTGWPSEFGSGLYYNRAGVGDFNGAWMLWKSIPDEVLRVNFGTGTNTWSGWKILADRDWVTSQLPTNYVTTGTVQTDLSGNKTTTGFWHWAPAENAFSTAPTESIYISKHGSITNPYIGGRDATGESFVLSSTNYSGDIQMRLFRGGYDAPVSGVGTQGQLHAGGSPIIRAITNGNVVFSTAGTNGTIFLRPAGSAVGDGQVTLSPDGVITASGLAGTGTQMVVANASGVLSRQAIPSSGVTSITAGTHLSGGTITTSGTIGLSPLVSNWIIDSQGNPRIYLESSGASSAGVIIRSSNNGQPFRFRNSDNTTVWEVSGVGTLNVGTVPWARLSGYPTLTAGNGLTGGGALDATRTITLGTPGTLTASTSNAVTSTSHTHSITTTTSGAANTIVQTNASGVITASGGNSTQWNTAFGWGDWRNLSLQDAGWRYKANSWAIQQSNDWTGFVKGTGGSPSGNEEFGFIVSDLDSDRYVMLSTNGDGDLSWRNNVNSWRNLWHNGNLANGTTSQYIRGDGSLAAFPSIPTVNNGTLTLSTGAGLTGSATFTANQSGNSTFTVGLSAATATTIGGIELFSNTVQSVAANAVTATASRTYGIQLNSAGQAVVNVPWTDNNTTYSAGNGLNLSGTTFSVGAGSGISVGSTSVGVDATVIRTTGNQSMSGVKTFTGEVVANVLTLGTVANATTTINMASNNLVRLNSISSNTTYTMSNNSDGRNVQCTVTNSNSSNSVTVTVSGAVLLGSNIIGPQKSAVISIINFGGGLTRYTVISEL